MIHHVIVISTLYAFSQVKNDSVSIRHFNVSTLYLGMLKCKFDHHKIMDNVKMALVHKLSVLSNKLSNKIFVHVNFVAILYDNSVKSYSQIEFSVSTCPTLP